MVKCTQDRTSYILWLGGGKGPTSSLDVLKKRQICWPYLKWSSP